MPHGVVEIVLVSVVPHGVGEIVLVSVVPHGVVEIVLVGGDCTSKCCATWSG